MSKIAIIGCGNMGSAYAKAFVQNNIVLKDDLYLFEKNSQFHPHLISLGSVLEEVNETIASCDIIVMAIKPQDALSVCTLVKPYINKDQLVLSIMAGIPISTLQEALNHTAIIRAMPNTPAQIGQGVTGFVAPKGIAVSFIEKASKLLSTTGKTVLIDNEDLMNAVTAVSGSGPAYFFFILKAIIEAAEELGLDSSTAALLAKETMNGSFQLLNNSDRSLTDLITAVTSKGGTTEAALKEFDMGNLSETIKKGIFSAEKRAKELSTMLA